MLANVSTLSQEEGNRVVAEFYNNFPKIRQQLQRENSLLAALYARWKGKERGLLWIPLQSTTTRRGKEISG